MAIPIGKLLAYEIGGGWGQEAPTDSEHVPAAVIRGTDIPRVALGETTTVPRRFHRPSAVASRLLMPNDIVFEVSGGSRDQPVGRTLLVSEGILEALGDKVMCASFCKLMRVDESLAFPPYVFHFLEAAYRDGSLGAYSVQSTGITNFKWKPFLTDFEVELPDRTVQERVAGVLAAIDHLILNSRRRIDLLEQMARAIYREWFVRFRHPGHEDDELVDSTVGPIPLGWEAVPIGSAIETLGGGTPSRKVASFWQPGSVTWFTPTDLTRSRAMFALRSAQSISDEGLAQSSAKAFPAGSVLLTSRATIGVVAISAIEASTNQGFIVCVPNEQLSSYYLYFWLLEHVPEFTTLATGATFKELSRGVFRQIPVLVPSTEVSARFRDCVQPMAELIATLLESVDRLEALRDLLLPKLVAGEIDVSTLDLDELDREAAA